MRYNELISRAIMIAVEAHEGQVDKAGLPYVTHPFRVMSNVVGDLEKVAAVLHDVVEDTEVSFEDLIAKGIPEEVVEAVNALTRRHGEEYKDFVIRAGDNKIARVVKIADLVDNMNIRRLPEIKERDVVRLNRYVKAYRYLVELL